MPEYYVKHLQIVNADWVRAVLTELYMSTLENFPPLFF